jgi:hypothetical protein
LHAFLAAFAALGGIDASVLMNLQWSFPNHVIGTSCDAFPARLTSACIQTNEGGRSMPDEWVAKFHEMLL